MKILILRRPSDTRVLDFAATHCPSAGVVESANLGLKILCHTNGVRVQVPPPAPMQCLRQRIFLPHDRFPLTPLPPSHRIHLSG